ncbi:MAG: O-antigen ligase family protein [Desulfobacteraceae bacterium]|jgi:O-antigen ligase
MMIKTIIFIVLFLTFVAAGLYHPIYGIIGYIFHYIVGPELQWWHAPLHGFGFRYSLILAAVTAISIVLHRDKLKFEQFFLSQEKLAILLLLLIWLLTLSSPETVNRYTITDHASVKMLKILIFCFMMTHVATLFKDLDKVLWALVIGALFLGLKAYTLPRSAFTGGRLDGVVGGSDFLDANALAAFMVAATVVVGIMFMRSSWRGKILCFITAAFSVNTIVLCRSRGAVLALLGAGVSMLFTAPKQVRKKLLIFLPIAAMGVLYLSDEQFIVRMKNIVTHADAVVEGAQSNDQSTMMRIEAWKGGLQMIQDHPFGVGPGNFNQFIGQYSPRVAGLSPHSTYIQSAAELGYIGFGLLIILFINGFFMAIKITRKCEELPEPQRTAYQWTGSGVAAVIMGYATYGITGHLMYVEALWWYLLLPVCLKRAFENSKRETTQGSLTETDEG